MTRRAKFAPLRGIALLVAMTPSCTMGPNYVRPPDNVPSTLAGDSGTAPVLATLPWWLTLKDPMLNGLIERARRASPDLGRAQAMVAEARAALAQAQAGGRPQLGGTASGFYGRSFTAPNYYGAAGAFGGQSFDASWELDLWGRSRRTVEAASANVEAATAEADDAMLTLLGDLARNYVALRGTQARIATARTTIDMQRRANELAAKRFDGGDGTKFEELQGGTALLQLQAELPLLEAQTSLLINALSVLCGDAPETLRGQLTPPGPIPEGPIPSAGIPADLIRRRPDVRSAERRLASVVAMIGAAEAERYPTLSLSGNLSFSGSAAASIMAMPLFALAPTIKLPFLDGGQREALVNIRRAQAEQARFAYRSAVLKALREVEDAMAQLRGQSLHRDKLKLAISTARSAVDTAGKLYQLGAIDFLQVVYAQRALSQSEDALAQAEAARTIQVVSLFKALGGGWQAP
jgi:NodT family efflux transporter outer membrane factor (OMF) lipoprotein